MFISKSSVMELSKMLVDIQILVDVGVGIQIHPLSPHTQFPIPKFSCAVPAARQSRLLLLIVELHRFVRLLYRVLLLSI